MSIGQGSAYVFVVLAVMQQSGQPETGDDLVRLVVETVASGFAGARVGAWVVAGVAPMGG